jgi:hypothetical protein
MIRFRMSLARSELYFAGTMPSDESIDDLPEESRRQEAIIVAIAAADFPDIISRPTELVALGNNDPGALVVKFEMTLYGGRNFNGTRGIGGRRMRDRQNHNDRCVVRGALDRKHDYARTIFAPFFPSRFVLVMPQIGIGYDEARLGRGYRHAPVLFWFKHGIEMRVPLVHA